MAQSNVSITLSLDKKKIKGKVTSEKFGLFLAQNWKRLIDPFTPRATGAMMEQAKIRPFEIEYIAPYSHYMYVGDVYVDPIYNAAGWFSEEVGWWSRPGVKKVPSGRTIKYGRVNPFATDHWDQKAAAAGKTKALINTAERALNAGLF